MVGPFPNKNIYHRRIVETWMADCVQNDGIKRHDELHIDRIDESWRESEFWIPASLEILDLATSIRDSTWPRDLSVALAFSLRSTPQKSGVDFATKEELQERLGSTPPSLYVFARGREPWIQPEADGVTIKRINDNIFGPSLGPKECFYMEFKEAGQDEYYRSVFITA
jgi:hypothetical protein